MDLKANIISCIANEADALHSLSQSIGDGDIEILKQLYACKGKRLFVGVGKSAIVGSKIAGTFTSLGFASLSLSPLDMLHGDLGFLQPDDLVVVVSYSGETDILVELIKAIKRLHPTHIISITGNRDSTIAQLSDSTKEIKVREAGPFGVVPSSSTTATMVYGDALAMALTAMKGLSFSDFQRFHPSGDIGKLKIGDIDE